MQCLRCGAEVKVDFMEPTRLMMGLVKPLCRGRDLIACLNRAAALVDPPDETPDPDQIPPADITVCSACKGNGSIATGRQDWETGAYEVIDCRWCSQTGVEPVCGVPGWVPVDHA